MMNKRLTKQFLKKSNGSIAIEFAFIAPVFLAIILSGLEAGMMFTRIALVEDATDEISRQIYTGAISPSEIDREALLDAFCGEIKGFISCTDNVTVEISTLTGGTVPSRDSAICQATGTSASATSLPGISSTGSGDVVYVRFCITASLIIPALKRLSFTGTNIGLQLPEIAPGEYAITSATVFRNEPF